jgi:hypothetical protein
MAKPAVTNFLRRRPPPTRPSGAIVSLEVVSWTRMLGLLRTLANRTVKSPVTARFSIWPSPAGLWKIADGSLT